MHEAVLHNKSAASYQFREVPVWPSTSVTMSNKQANLNEELEGWFRFARAKRSRFFLQRGKRIFYSDSPELEQVGSHDPILELAGSINWNYATVPEFVCRRIES
jgi:hypothetical protein